MSDCITVSRLRVPVYIGVPDEERAEAQEIEISLDIVPNLSLMDTGDQIDKTIDYYQLSQEVVKIAQSRPRKLIETLNEEILRMVHQLFPVEAVTVTTHKFIIPETEYVAIKMSLRRSSLA